VELTEVFPATLIVEYDLVLTLIVIVPLDVVPISTVPVAPPFNVRVPAFLVDMSNPTLVSVPVDAIIG
jgi:hypothetical protein